MKIPIVNENDEIIEYKERGDRNPKDKIRATGLWLTDNMGNILIAQRALAKKDCPGLWGPAVAGTVEEGETYEENIIKEAEEEIGLQNLVPQLGPKVKTNTTFGQWFTAVVDHNYPFKKLDEEVEAIKWISRKELDGLVEEKPEIFMNYFSDYKKYF